MKSIRPLALATALFLGFASVAAARAVRIWSYQELLDKSDLVVFAQPNATNDTNEHIDLPGFIGQHVTGIETKFAVSAVVKGDKALKDLIFHHYRTTGGMMLPNGPTLISFDPMRQPTFVQPTFILFLHREADGRYASIVGQVDPRGGIKELK